LGGVEGTGRTLKHMLADLLHGEERKVFRLVGKPLPWDYFPFARQPGASGWKTKAMLPKMVANLLVPPIDDGLWAAVDHLKICRQRE
jgi:hypothetical protein